MRWPGPALLRNMTLEELYHYGLLPIEVDHLMQKEFDKGFEMGESNIDDMECYCAYEDGFEDGLVAARYQIEQECISQGAGDDTQPCAQAQ